MAILGKIFGQTQDVVQSDDETALCTYVKSRVEEVRMTASRVAQEATWLTNTAYVLGFDSIYWDSQFKQFRAINNLKRPLQLNRIHVNMILPTMQNRLAKLCKNPPRYDVLPENASSEAKDSARLALQVLTMQWERLEINRKRIELLMWVMQAGHAFLKVYWDPLKGRIIQNPLTGESDFEGDVEVDVKSPLNIFSDPMASSDDHAKWKVEANIRRLSYFKDNYPDKGMLVKEESAWLLSLQYETQLNNMNGAPTAGGSQLIKNSAIELIYYEKPSRKHPRGRQVVTANGILLEDKELPVGIIPLIKFDDITIGGKYYPEAIVTHLRPLQDQYNDLLRRRQEWVRKLLNGKILAQNDSNIKEEAFRSDAAEIITYDMKPGGLPPTPLQMPMIPNYAYEEEEKLKSQFGEISGISQPSKGQMPSSSIPAIGMQMLVEADDTRIGIETEGHEIGYAKTGKLILEYIKEGYQTDRVLKSAGQPFEYAIKEFKGSDIESTDVLVIRGSTLPGSKTLRRQELLNAFTQGLIGDPSDPKVRQKVFAQLEFSFLGEMWEDYALSEGQIRRQIEMIEQGITPPMHELDDHALAMLMLNRIRISDKFDTFTPQIQQLFNDQIEAHIQALMKIANPDLAAQEKVDEQMKQVKGQIAQSPQMQQQLNNLGEPPPGLGAAHAQVQQQENTPSGMPGGPH